MVIERLDFIFCSDNYLLKINKKFLAHDYYTDVISFNLNEEPDKTIGEVYISTERVKENSRAYNVSFEDELVRVIFHGSLHLCGYQDKSNAEYEQMKFLEDQYLLELKTMM